MELYPDRETRTEDSNTNAGNGTSAPAGPNDGYKLKLNHGDLKATQGDTGHSQIDMITDVYAHILDEDRKVNAQKFETTFYAKNSVNPLKDVTPPEDGNSDLANLISALEQSPELVAMLTKALKQNAISS